jgi:hypothetical protein
MVSELVAIRILFPFPVTWLITSVNKFAEVLP